MKNIVMFLICIAIGMGIGWYFGSTRPAMKNQRELLKQDQYFKDHTKEFDSGVDHFKELTAEYAREAKPYATSTASMALTALKHLETNDVEAARSRLATIVAIYYNVYKQDGETNLLGDIKKFAAKDIVLSNSMVE